METVRFAGGETPQPSENSSQGDPHDGDTPIFLESANRAQQCIENDASPNAQPVKVPDLSADAGP